MTYQRKIFGILFGIYVILLFYLTLFSPTFLSQRSINLVPFKTILPFLKIGGRAMVINIIGNILAFVPIGLLFPLLEGKVSSIKNIISASFILSFIVELLQFLFALRVADVDDLILNVAGGVLGYFIYILIKWIILI